MRIVVVGVDHSTTPIALRERLACSSRHIPQVLNAIKPITQECVLLSTCNRIELYAVFPASSELSTSSSEEDALEDDALALLHILSETRNVPYEELKACASTFHNEAAISHLCGVASGLYSLVPGEPQIQGQVVQALEIAQAGGYAGPVLSALFRAAVVAGKRTRSETAISRNAVSISHVAVQLARRLFPNLNEASVLLVGTGKMSELAARNLCDHGARQLVLINRTQANAVQLAQSLGTHHRPFTELAEALLEADVVISSTTASRAIITMELMQRVMKLRTGRSLLLIDIALPRDVEPTVATLPGVYLYNVDDLQVEVKRGISLRMQEVEHAQAIIAEEVAAFQRWFASLSIVSTISDLRQHAEDLRQQELARTMRQLAPHLSERETVAIQQLSTRLVNKLLHTPMLRLKEAAAAGQGHTYAEALRYLFDLEDKYKYEANNDRNTQQQISDDTNTVGDRAVTPVAPRS